jgi:hypothetical protein
MSHVHQWMAGEQFVSKACRQPTFFDQSEWSSQLSWHTDQQLNSSAPTLIYPAQWWYMKVVLWFLARFQQVVCQEHLSVCLPLSRSAPVLIPNLHAGVPRPTIDSSSPSPHQPITHPSTIIPRGTYIGAHIHWIVSKLYTRATNQRSPAIWLHTFMIPSSWSTFASDFPSLKSWPNTGSGSWK